jgi:hypothetical protein
MRFAFDANHITAGLGAQSTNCGGASPTPTDHSDPVSDFTLLADFVAEVI